MSDWRTFEMLLMLIVPTLGTYTLTLYLSYVKHFKPRGINGSTFMSMLNTGLGPGGAPLSNWLCFFLLFRLPIITSMLVGSAALFFT